ncbi:unnamed protein product [Dibothriocephalus latus]|uniref:Uncharacterized protein n=1 Tax=Dibothriocephalus latus TaxID=60516 RepID=A0A3P7LIJ8_DIBLA|nr:unnamed protein product [Dibothriocephalus latus]
MDRRTDKNCDTGRFEVIYKQQLPPKTIFNGVDLTVSGTRMSSVTSAESSQPTTRAPSVRRQQTPSTNFTEPRSVESASPFTGTVLEGKTPIPPVVGQRTPQKYTNSPSLRITGTSTAYQKAATGIQERIHMSGESTAAHRSSQPSASLHRESTASEDHLKSWGVGSGSSEPRKSGGLSRDKTVAQPKLMATYARSTSRDEKRVLPRNVSCPPKCPVTGAGQAGDSNERSVARVHVASRLQPVIPPSTGYRSPAGIELRVPKTENLMRSIVDFHKTKYQRAGESDSPVLCLHNSNANNSESPSSKEPEKKTSNQKPVVCSRESCEDIVDSDSLHQDLTSMGFAVLKSPLQSVTCVKTASSRKKLPKTLPISKQPQPRKFDNSSPKSYKILKMRPQAVAGEISTIRTAVRLRAK